MRSLMLIFGLWVVLLALPCPAWAWSEATLQQVDIQVDLAPDGRARIKYDLRYHVDRGRFEGITIEDPGQVILWDRMTSYIEDARGQRVGVNVTRRHRDGAYLIRKARGSGFSRGWVTVHLEYAEDLQECCIRTDSEGRSSLSWTALSWDVGMDRMTISVHLLEPIDGLQADESTARDFNSEPLPDGLVIERIRPVRWYRPRLGLILPQGWLNFEPAALDDEQGRPDPEAEATLATSAPLPIWEAREGQGLANLFLAITALIGLLLLGLKWWVLGQGYPGTLGPAPPLVLPGVPTPFRWAVLGVAFLAGAWLQSASFLAAGTLAMAAGILLSLRGPTRTVDAREPEVWWQTTPQHMIDLFSESRRGRRAFASLLDGTSLVGFGLLLVVTAGVIAALIRLSSMLPTYVVDSLVIDGLMLISATMLTGRRRDLPPSRAAGAVTLLLHTMSSLGRALKGMECHGIVMAGGSSCIEEPERFRLCLDPPPAGYSEVRVEVTPGEGINGWFLSLVATIVSHEGEVKTIESRSPRRLARRLRRQIATSSSPTTRSE